MKKVFLIMLALIACANIGFAQVVTVTGTGVNKESATRDAMRLAVENVVGTMVSSQTIVQNASVVSDEIYSKAQGFVRNISLLKEGPSGGAYQVTAQIDVDTNPNSALMQRLETIMLLKDPRISVIIFGPKDESGNVTHEEVAETAINSQLIDMGFTHVVDANTVSKLKNSLFLNSIYQNLNGTIGELGTLGVDYLVIGKSVSSASNVVVNGITTQMVSGRAALQVKLIKADTGDIVGTFTVDGVGLDGDLIMAAHKALEVAGKKAGEELTKKFRQQASKPGLNVQIEVRGSASEVQAVGNNLRNVAGVSNVYVREANGGVGIIELESKLQPNEIYNGLRANSSLGLILDGFTNSGFKVTVI